jgi:hypothetical protein
LANLIKPSISPSDLKPIAEKYAGCRAFERMLRQLTANCDFFRFFARYTYFNSVFGAGVANLVGDIARRLELFRDPQEPARITSDRSVEIAADFFATIVDEFAGKSESRQPTHRRLAQTALKSVSVFFGYEPASLNDPGSLNTSTLSATKEVLAGYGILKQMDEMELFEAMGFHLGSEMLADEEFRILDAFLKSRFPELLEFMNNSPRIFNGDFGAESWVCLHARIEADHFELALSGSNRAIEYYAGTNNRTDLKAWTLEGFAKFARVQATFMENLMKG